MANALILPTFELVTECLPYDQVFAKFLRGGVKDVVRESVVGQSFYRRHLPPDPLTNRSGLLAGIIHSFDEYCAQEWGDAHTEPGTSFMDQYLGQIAIIEFVVHQVEEATEDMLYHVLRQMRMRQFEADEHETHWQGRDLVVYLRHLNRIRSY